MLKQGRISKNEVICKDGAEKVIPQTDVVCLDGTPIQYEQFHYLMLYKPAGCVTATEDAHAKTVMDYIPAERRRNLSPVGRLDKDTEGLLLLTDDGALNHRLLAPGKHVPKTYYAKIDGTVTEREVTLLLKDWRLEKETDRSCNSGNFTFRRAVRDSCHDYRRQISSDQAHVSCCRNGSALSETAFHGNVTAG